MLTREDFLKSLEEFVQMDPNTLQGHEKLQEIEGWDSLAMVSLIALADDNGVSLSPKSIAACATVNDLVQLVKVEG
jgi:acyl carrier protein